MIDVLVSWPRSVDYPVFRQLMARARPHYEQLIISFTGLTTSQTLEKYVKGALPWAHYTIPSGAAGDWRHVAVTDGLVLSDAEYVLFMEQDFFILDPDLFFRRLRQAIAGGAELVGFREADRIHPACLLVSRELLEKTSKDFGVGGVGQDHFWRVTKELEDLTKFIDIESLDMGSWYHLAGLTHNYDRVRAGKPANHRPLQFGLYNLVGLRIGSHPDFEALMERCVAGVAVESLLFGGI